MDKRTLARDCYVQALQKSVYLTEALDSLLQHEMLMAWEEKELLQSIMPNKAECNEADLKILGYLYDKKLKKYYTTSSQVSLFLINFSAI
jgi:anaphase-promoting complex subunit 6